MLQASRSKTSKIFFYIVLFLAVLAMVAFGITGIFSKSTAEAVANIGDETVTSQQYYLALQQELRRASQQTGQTITIDQAIQFGIDKNVLQRLATRAAYDGEAKRLGISVSDETVRADLLKNPNFQGLDGKFDKTVYKDLVQRSGLTAVEYEAVLRNDTALRLIENGLVSGVALPDAAYKALFDYLGENRSFTYAKLTASDIRGALPDPQESDLQTYYDAHPDEFTQPLTRNITYISLTPEQMAAQIDVSDAEIAALFERNADQFNTPAKRYLDRIAFGDTAEAAAALERINSGAASFDDIVAERGLKPGDTDLGEVTAADLNQEVADMLFSATDLGVYGPVNSDIGPALFRINAATEAVKIPIADVKDQLSQEIALGKAGGQIADAANNAIDLVAGGATLSEVANETPMELGTIALAEGDTSGIAAYAEFRDEASATSVGEERDIVDLSDGGIFALRVDSIDEAHVLPFETVRADVVAAWTKAKTTEMITRRANEIIAAVKGSAGGSLSDFNAILQTGTVKDATRNSTTADLPPSVVPATFSMQPGELKTFDAVDTIILVQLDSVTAFDPADPRAKAGTDAIIAQNNDQVAQDIMAYFGLALVRNAKTTINQARVDALHTQLQ